ncbi:hypothetical protein HS125_16230 [bacterium]|nr:hypothetical protein [bacterium]
MKIEIRVDGGPAVGMGHVVRCVALARALGPDCRFMMRYSLPAVRYAREAGLPVLLLPDEDANPAAAQWAAAAGAELLIVDLFDVPRSERELLASVGCPTVTLADLGYDDLPGDLLFNGFIGFGKHEERPTRFGGMAYLGTDFKLVRAPPRQDDKAIPALAQRILVTAGGGDATGMTALSLAALAQLDLPLSVVVLEGPAMDVESDVYRASLADFPHPIERRRAGDPFAPAAAADLAISAGGDTVYELAVLGAPTLILCHVDHQLQTAAAFAAEGAAENLGLVRECTPEQLAAAVEALARDPDRRAAFSHRARRLVDGGGLARTVQTIRRLCSSP